VTERLLTVPEAAAFLGYSRNQLYVLCRAEKIPHIRIPSGKANDVSRRRREGIIDATGRRREGIIRFDLAELRAWLEANRRGPAVALAGRADG
jgi:hypothetical protein